MSDGRIEVVTADITTLDVDAIVNAANQALAGGGGVDGAIHRAAGAHALHAACAELGGCATGDAKITPGFQLPARFIIHAVGPRWRGGTHGEPDLLASCYRRALEVATGSGLESVAFPAISTGVYGYPAADAADVAATAVTAFLANDAKLRRVVFCCFNDASAALHRHALERVR
ncbi:MAG: O-acetyl-ADP-ribose deacetylase [Caulobacteraceae bacterium]|nr:O-acetyl-ADP-ribose deacetylase [Caulobacter sp.]